MSAADQSVVIISREGSFLSPQPITIDVSVAHGAPRMDASMPLDGFMERVAGVVAYSDYVEALVAAMPHPTTVWTRDQLDKALFAAAMAARPQLAAAIQQAADVAVVALKHEIARVM